MFINRDSVSNRSTLPDCNQKDIPFLSKQGGHQLRVVRCDTPALWMPGWTSPVLQWNSEEVRPEIRGRFCSRNRIRLRQEARPSKRGDIVGNLFQVIVASVESRSRSCRSLRPRSGWSRPSYNFKPTILPELLVL